MHRRSLRSWWRWSAVLSLLLASTAVAADGVGPGAVRKQIEWPNPARANADGKLEVVQFERLIGQLTETVRSAYLEVDRAARFCPIKVREDLQKEAEALLAFARDAGVV